MTRQHGYTHRNEWKLHYNSVNVVLFPNQATVSNCDELENIIFTSGTETEFYLESYLLRYESKTDSLKETRENYKNLIGFLKYPALHSC